MKILASGLFASAVLAITSPAATFTVTPGSIANDYAGAVMLKIEGVAPGKTVDVVQFYDFNGNGVMDGPDLAVRGEILTDGSLKSIAGLTNRNQMQDEDGTVNGSIHASFLFASAPDLARGVGHYVFRVHSPSNDFADLTAPLTVTSALFGQTVAGVVKSSGTNVPYAAVALIEQAGGRTGAKVFVGGSADASGSFTLQAPSGAFDLVAFRAGYVMDLTTAPHLVLATNSSVTTNLTLIAADTQLSGSLVDEANTSSPAVPYSALTLFSTNLLFTVSVADSNANFSVPVTANVWTIRPEWQSAVTKGYLPPEQGSYFEPSVDTGFGPVTGANVTFKKATALIYGQVQDNLSNSIPGVVLSASADGGSFSGLAVSDSEGLYAMAIDAGGGFVNVEQLNDRPAKDYLWSGDFFNIAADQSLNLNVIGKVVTAHFRGQLVDDTGSPLNQFGIYANNSRGGTSQTSTDTNGFFDLPVAGGNWQLYADGGEAFQGVFIFPSYSFQITDGIDLTNRIVVPRATGTITGSISDPSGLVSSSLYVSLSATAGSTDYKLNAYSDANGNYSVRVFNGTWTVSLSPYDLLNRNYNPANPLSVTIPPTNGIANFVLLPIGPAGDVPRITTQTLPDAFVGQQYKQTLSITNGVRSFDWTIASGALPSGLDLDGFLGSISGKATTPGVYTFTARVEDSRGKVATNALTLRVQSAAVQAPVLDLPEVISGKGFNVRVTGNPGQSYTLQSTGNLGSWNDILTTNAPAKEFFLQDPNASGAVRFYRLKANP